MNQYLLRFHADTFIVMYPDQLARLLGNGTEEGAVKTIWKLNGLDGKQQPEPVYIRTHLLDSEPADGGTRTYHLLSILNSDHEVIDEARFVRWAA